MPTIATLTMNPAVDMFLEAAFFTAGQKIRCSSPVYRAGGGGLTVSRAIRGLGGDSIALFLAGGDTGDLLTTLLQQESIRTDCVRVSGATRQNVIATDRAHANEYRFVVPGAEMGAEEWKHCLRALESISPTPDYVVASGSLPPGVPLDFYGRVAAIAVKKGFRLIVDTYGEALRHAARIGTFLLKPNMAEFTESYGHAMLGQKFLEGAAKAIVEARGVSTVVISTGAAGATLVDTRGVRTLPAPPVDVSSHFGAGDSMVGGLALALARGCEIDDAVRFGIAAGASAVTSAPHELCSQRQTETLYSEMRAAVALSG